MSDAEREQERRAAAREDLIAYMRCLPKEPPRPPRSIPPGSSALAAAGLLMRLRAVRRVWRLVILLVVSLVVSQLLLPGRGAIDLAFVPVALWQAVGALGR